MSDRSRKGTAALLASVHRLAASNDVTELAAAAAQLAQEAVGGTAALVLLRGDEGTYRSGPPATPDDLEGWVEELSREGVLAGVVASRGKLAGPIQAHAVGFQGVVVVSEPSIGEEEARAALSELGRLVSTCLGQMVSRERDSRALSEGRAAMAKGLHDLRTPLNSLRLGMHLLGPGLAGQDQAVVDRTHRAIDRMAALVTEIYESVSKR